jgi:mannosyltransferase
MISGLSLRSVASPSMAPPRERWWPWWGLPLLILLVYVALAFFRIGHQSFWGDEVRSLESANPNGPLLTHELLFRGQGPAYFAVLHFWAKLSTNEAFLRALSALLGGVGVVLMYVLGLRVFNRQVAAIGTILFATSPFLIWYSQEVRYVIFMIAAALLAMLSFARVLLEKRRGGWSLYGASHILAIAASPINVFLLVAQGLYLACSLPHRQILRNWLACQLVFFALFVWWANGAQVRQLGGYWQRLLAHITTSSEGPPSLEPIHPLIAGDSETVAEMAPPPYSSFTFSTGGTREFTLMALPYTFFAFSTGFSLGPSLRELHISRDMATLSRHAFIVSLSGFLFGGLCLVGFANLWRQPDLWKLLTAWLAVPLIGILAVSALIPSMAYNARYVAMSWPAYCLVLALGITSCKRTSLRLTLLAAVLLVNALSLGNYYFNPWYSREDARSAAQFLEEAAHPRDIILVAGNMGTLKYYYKETVPMVGWGEKTINDLAVLTERLQEFARHHDHLWLVELRPWETDPKGIVKAALDTSYNVLAHQAFPGVDIYRYRLD